MPRPLPGMVTVAEFGSRFDADLASARLHDSGIENTVLGDPAASIAPHHVTERWFTVCVRAEVADLALEALTHDHDVLVTPAPAGHRFRDRPWWIRALTWALILAIPVPLLLSLVLVGYLGTRSLFP